MKHPGTTDILHGEAVHDPYRWLEDGDSADTQAFTEAQNAKTRAHLDAMPGRAKLHERIRALLAIGFVGPPVVRVGPKGERRWFYERREGGQNQPVLLVRERSTDKARTLLDPGELSKDGTTALDWWYPSTDGTLLAWGRSEGGSEESVLHVRDVVTGEDLPDRIPHTRHASVAWLPGRSGFYYSRYPEPGTVPPGDERYGSRIYLHRLGDDPAKDALVFGEGRDKTDVPQVFLSPDGMRLVVRVHQGWDRSEVHYRHAAAANGPWIAIAAGVSALFEPTPMNDRLYLHTNDGASRYELFAVDWQKPERARWKRVLPEGVDVLSDVVVTEREILATYMHEAASRVERFGLDGKALGQVPLPGIGSATVTAAREGDEAFIGFTSYVVPPEVHRVDLARPASAPKVWDRLDAGFAAADVEVTRMSATSKDGTRVPMFVIARRNLPRNGKNPTALYGYGGFNVNQTPAFSARALTVVRAGGVWVSAILRGGGELGEAWHRAGMLERKQNVFDDFIACAEALIAEKITSPDHLAVIGGSNGGLLVAAVVTQRPELFRAGLSLVPLTDMLRYHHFRIGKLWVPEYGSADDPAQYRFLRAYSPYHAVRPGKRYPAMLFTTAEGDSRVDPLHARKMAARMDEAQADRARKILLRVETKAGHGAGKPTSKLADELADELTFMLAELGAPP